MTVLNFGFGNTFQKVKIPDKNLVSVLLPNEVNIALTGEEEVKRALASPIGTPTLDKIVKPGEKIVIVTSDITRPMPTNLVMPIILDTLYQAGIKADDITLVFALGSHRVQTQEEQKKIVGERVYNEIRCIDGNIEDTVRLGITKRGTPIDIVRVVVEANRRICIGNIEYHYFAGYSGGAKAIMPGVSTREAIQNNHSLMINNAASAGSILGNPVREDIEEAASICGVDFILNVVLDENKKIIFAVAGDVKKAHRAGCDFLDKLYLKLIPQRADIVLVSQGGFPKDLNLYQAQKALDNAKHAVKKGGIIILIASCKEGFGEHIFEEWMINSSTIHSIIEKIQTNFELGGHKAAAIAMVLEMNDIYLVSELPKEDVTNVFLKPFSNAQDAFNCALEKLGDNTTVLAMPYGGSTLPRVELNTF